jgi:hypothetical protein
MEQENRKRADLQTDAVKVAGSKPFHLPGLQISRQHAHSLFQLSHKTRSQKELCESVYNWMKLSPYSDKQARRKQKRPAERALEQA